jgi:putative FmdB family regulatory protein
MPFYEYECPSCRYYAEVMQKISDAPLKKCPSCGKAGFKRLISAPVFRLKGSGWYETDFKSDKEGKRNLAGADKDDAKPAAEGKTEAKTEAKADAGSAPAAAKPQPVAASKSASKTGSGAASAGRPPKARPVKAAPARRAGGAAKAPARRK